MSVYLQKLCQAMALPTSRTAKDRCQRRESGMLGVPRVMEDCTVGILPIPHLYSASCTRAARNDGTVLKLGTEKYDNISRR
jgi:hypothetical protein